MTLDELIAIQKAQGLGEAHLAYIGHAGFLIAHTDYERDSGLDLRMCGLHQWLTQSNGPPAPVGVYIILPREHDGYSESFRSEAAPWVLQPL